MKGFTAQGDQWAPRIIHALRFEPCSQCPSGIGVSAILFPAGGDAEAHALNYGFVLQGCQLLQSFNEAWCGVGALELGPQKTPQKIKYLKHTIKIKKIADRLKIFWK
eukprot:2088675-Amphidinium_carterae.1